MLGVRTTSTCRVAPNSNVAIHTVSNGAVKTAVPRSTHNIVSSLPWTSKVAVTGRTFASTSKGASGPAGAGGKSGDFTELKHGQTLMEIENQRVVALQDMPAEEIKLDLANKLLKEELQIIDDFEELSFHNAIAKRWLQESKFKLQDNNDGTATLTRSDGVHNVRVTFKTYDQQQEEEEKDEDEEGEGEFGEEGQEGENDGMTVVESGASGEPVLRKVGPRKGLSENEDGPVIESTDVSKAGDRAGEGEPLPKRQDFIADVEFVKKGKVKGTWRLHCFSGHQNRLYIDAMQVLDGSVAQPKNLEDPEELVPSEVKVPHLYAFDTLTTETQDRIYDFMDKIGLDDQLSHFVKQYPSRKKSTTEAVFLNRLKELFVSTVPADYKPMGPFVDNTQMKK